MSHSQRSVDRDWIPQSQRSHSDRPRRERPSHNGSTNVNQEAYRSDRDRRERRSQERLSTQAPSRGQNSRAPTVTSDHNSRYSRSSLPQYGPTTTRSITENRTFSEKCSSLCSRRAGCMSKVGQNRKLLLAEEVFNVTAGITYIICVALYIHFIKQINATDVCKQRESLYNRRGYNSVTCDILGTEMAASVFAVILIVLYAASAVVVGLLLHETKSDENVLNSESLKNTNEEIEPKSINLKNENNLKIEVNSYI